ESRESHRRRAAAGQPRYRAAGRYLRAGIARGRVEGIRRTRGKPAGDAGGGAVPHREEGERVHAGLGTAAVGLGAGSRTSCLGWQWGGRLGLPEPVFSWNRTRMGGFVVAAWGSGARGGRGLSSRALVRLRLRHPLA